MKANSPPGASSRLVSTLAAQGTPNIRQSGTRRAVLATIMAMKPPITSTGSRQMKPRSICMPTEKKKTPSSSPRKGSIIASTARRYSVSASSKPAMKAPSAIERPAKAAITPEPTAISRVAAMKNSGLSVLAASRNNGFSTSRPTSAITATATAASTRAMMTPWATEPSEWPPSALIRNSSGTTARSCASRMAKLVRPVVDIMRRWPDSNSITMAVEESARQAPMMSAAAGRLAEPQGDQADDQRPRGRPAGRPAPNTRRRMVTRRRIDSSRPMKNSRKTMPRSAMKAICLSPVTVSQSMARE